MRSRLIDACWMTCAELMMGALLVTAIMVPQSTVAQQEGAAKTQATAGDAKDAPKEILLKVSDKESIKAVLIPAGKFTMGSPEVDKDRYYDESPQHEVTLTKSFYMGIYEVTQAQFEAVMGKNPSPTKGDANPVEDVSWADSVAFCQKLSQMSGKTVRLPTEAEWEYACRAGTTTRFSFGDDETQLGDYGWYSENSGHQSRPVGQKKPNPWVLYDMHGNVFEWCSNSRGIVEAYRTAQPVTDPQGPDAQAKGGSGRGGGGMHVLRGGSWVYAAQKCRSATRGFAGSGPWYFCFGFRIVIEAQ